MSATSENTAIPTISARREQLDECFVDWVPRTLDAWLDHCAEQYADRAFVITDDVTLSYAEVAEQSRVIADALVTLGVQPGDHVGMLMANYPEFVPFKLGIARTGAVAIPFNFLYRTDELRYVLDQSDCSVLLTMTGFAGLDYLDMLDAIAPGWESAPAGSKLREVVVLSTDGRTREGARTYADLLELGTANPGAAGTPEHRPDDIADMLYTSGSTGSPKGVLVTHDAVLRTGYASAYTRAYEDGRRILFSLPCYHMFGYVEGILSAMYVGGAVVLQTTFSAEGYLAGIERHRATDILCVPTMAIAMVESESASSYDTSSLTAILCGSTIAPMWLWDKVESLFGVSEIVTGYGMTECGGAMTLTLPEDDLTLSTTTVGRPKLAGAAGIEPHRDLVAYSTIDPLTSEPLPAGEPGELVSRGPTTMIGYYGKPEETAAALSEDRVLRSGDLGRVRQDGYLEVTGRSKELYKSGGELVMPKEVEDVLAQHPEVSQAFAVGVMNERWGEIGCAVIVRTPGSELTEAAVIEHCKEHLARFKVPKQVLFLTGEQLPTTPTGKVQKYKLGELANAGDQARTEATS